jgi:hypothetical protein
MAQEAIPFDTHRFVRNLVAGGFTERQAEVLAYEQVKLINTNLSTTYQIDRVRLSISSRMELARLSIEAKIESAKFEIVKWLIGAMIAQGTLIVGLTVALNKLL